MLREKKLFLLDIDGTVCKGRQLFGGTKAFLTDVKQSGGQFVFITNNATKSIHDYIKFFEELGITTDCTNYVTASYATVQYLKLHYANQLIYVMGTHSFIRELKKNHIRVTTDCKDEEIACVLVSYDSQLTYEKVQDTCELLSTKQVDYIATNPDLVCPIEFGYVPDCGAICEMIAHAVKKTPYYIGKPEPDMVEYALKMNHFTKEETLIVGDRLYTDILCGCKAGVQTALVLTGESSMEDVEQCAYKPDYVFHSLESIHKEWKL
ncbi:MAG: HAD-IIA family hydrolase [Lachnospiraceae bacterium]